MINQTIKPFEYGEKWYVDSDNGNDFNDGRSWNSSKKTLQNAINSANSGDIILARGFFNEDITISNKNLMIVCIGETYIAGTNDLTKSIITIDSGTVIVVGGTLGIVWNADQSCILLDNPIGSQSEQIVEIFGAVDDLNVGWWIGDSFNTEELTSNRLLEKYVANVVQKPSPGDTTLVVQGNIAVEPWLSVKKFMQRGHALIPAYITRIYQNITYDSGNDVSIISGIDPPFTQDTLPGDPPKNQIYLCAIKINPSQFTAPHFAGEQITNNPQNLKNLISIQGLALFPVIFVGSKIMAFISPQVQFPVPVANVIFDGCWFMGFNSVGRYFFNFIMWMPFSPFAIRDSVFLLTESSGIARIYGVTAEVLHALGAPMDKDFRDLLKAGGFYHNIISVVSFGNFDTPSVRNWITSKIQLGLVIGREATSIDPNTGITIEPLNLELPFAENLWVKYAMSGFFPKYYDIVKDINQCPSGNVASDYKDKSPLSNVAPTEESLVFNAVASIKDIIRAKKIEIIK